MSSSIIKILNSHQVYSEHHTHVSMIQPKGKFSFTRQDLEEFWDIYCNAINEEEDTIVGTAEKPQSYLPVLVDVDIRVKERDDIEDKLYTDDHVQSVIQVYQSILRTIVDECEDENLICILLEKDLYRITKGDITYVKNGFHLHFPNLILSKADQEVHLIPRVQDALNEMNVFGDIGFDNSGDLIDKSCCKVPWLLYGSRKSEEMKPYKVTKVFNSECNEISLKKALSNYQLFDMKENLIDIKGKIKYYLPRILSILPYGRETKETRRGLVPPIKEKMKKEREKNSGPVKKLSVVESLSIAKKLLPLLSNFRCDDRNEWMTVGWILYNIGESSHEALELWLEFSSRSEKYDEAVCIYEWDRMVAKDLTIGTLKYYASVDNPELYLDFKKEQIAHYIKESLNGSHNDIAKVLYTEYGNNFVCASVTGKIWFQFINHKWEMIEDGVFLREKISNEIVQRYIDMGKEEFAKIAVTTDKGEEAMHNSRLKTIQKMTSSLKSAPYKSNIMKECLEVFYDRRFREKLDTNPYLIAFKNGVYDLKDNIFRPGRPEDFLSKSLPISYKEFQDDDEEVHNVYSFLEKVFPDKSIRTYFMDMSSDIFVGGNHQKVVLFWTGEGDNGKSVTQSIFEKMLGELAIKFSTTLITGKKTSTGTANPELSRAGGGVRWAVLEEPDGDEQINIGTLKALSGNDSYWARDLFEKGKDTREIQPLFKLIFICNKLPKMKYSDKATWNRIRVIPFESTFCRPEDPAPETYEEQLEQKRFPMDKEFSKKIPGMLQAFAWVLLEHRKKITIRIEPEKVRQATALYRKQNDIYRQYVEETISECSKSCLSLAELYPHFKDWFRDSLPHHTVPIKNEVKEYFAKLWGDPEPGCKWSGYRIRALADDIANGDAIVLEEEDLINYEEEKNLPPI